MIAALAELQHPNIAGLSQQVAPVLAGDAGVDQMAVVGEDETRPEQTALPLSALHLPDLFAG
jgi:hypothetical protein